MDDLLSEFLTETSESIATLDVEIVRLEQEPNDPGLIDNIFRLVHTIKGTCGFLGLPRLEQVAHSSENILGKFRDGSLVVTPDAVSLILASLDRIKDILAQLEATEAEPDGDDQDLIVQLDEMAEGKSAGAPATTEAAPEPAAEEVVAEEAIPEEQDPNYDAALGRMLKPGETHLDELERLFQETETEAPDKPPVAAAAAPAAAKLSTEKVANESAVANQSIRVSVDLLENLMTMVSE